MSDFVAEIKPRSLYKQSYASLPHKEDFIAEIKSRSYGQPNLAHISSDYFSDTSDVYLQKVLSGTHFSRERTTNLLESSILTLIEKLLTGQSISRITGTLCVSLSTSESPIVVNLQKAFPKVHNCRCSKEPELESSLNVKIKDRECSPLEKLSGAFSPYYDFSRDSCHSPAGSESSALISSGYHTENSLSSPSHDMQTASPSHDMQTASPSHDIQTASPLHDMCQTASPSHTINGKQKVSPSQTSCLSHDIQTASPLHDMCQTASPSHTINGKQKVSPSQTSCLSHDIQTASPLHDMCQTASPSHTINGKQKVSPSQTSRLSHDIQTASPLHDMCQTASPSHTINGKQKVSPSQTSCLSHDMHTLKCVPTITTPVHSDNRTCSPSHAIQMPCPPHILITSSSHDSRTPSPSHDSRTPSPSHGSGSPTSLHILSSSSTLLNPDVEDMEMIHSDNNRDTYPYRDSDLESGYTSNEKEDSDIHDDNHEGTIDRNHISIKKAQNTFNDYFCCGFDGENTLHIPSPSPASDSRQNVLDYDSYKSSGEGGDEMDECDDDDVESEHRLVIDETLGQEMETVHAESICLADNDDSKGHCKGGDFSEGRSQSFCVEDDKVKTRLEDVDSVVKLDTTDIDSNIGFTRNNKIAPDDMSVIPHPQSIVSKHPGGFKCKKCFNILADTIAVSAHVLQSHDLHCCTYCCRTFTAKNNLKRHIRRHTGQRPYKCLQCPRSFFRKDDLKGHVIRHDYSKQFRCSLCKKGYTDRASVKNHMAKEHRSRLTQVCPQCGESFDGDEAFTVHKRTHTELEQFACNTCSFIGTNNLMTLKHNLLHSHKLFSCKPCNAYFADPFHYTTHVKKHKKNAEFTQYICCFCDAVSASYDQYVRHEYSHAQGKTHTCIICKKQFKNKFLLQDHAITHQTVTVDVVGTELKYADHMDTKEPQSMSWRLSEVKEDYIIIPSAHNTSENAEEFLRRSRDSDAQMPLPTTVQETDDVEYSGLLLDLSMKKLHSPAFTNDNNSNSKSLSGNASLKVTGQTVQNFPRNGVVYAEPVNMSLELGTNQPSIHSRYTVEAENKDGISDTPLFTLRDVKVSSEFVTASDRSSFSLKERRISTVNNAEVKVSSKLETSNQSNSEDSTKITSSGPNLIFERRTWQHAIMNRNKDIIPLRFNPYHREKMADLAAKFVAARGTKLTGERTHLKAIVPLDDERKPIIAREQENIHKKRRSLAIPSNLQSIRTEESALRERETRNQALQRDSGNDEVICENSFLGTTPRCHIPTVIKSEPLLVHTEFANSPLDCRSHKAKGHDINTDIIANNGSSYSCEVCKEQFGSFMDLENHSVEIHKRYLCEHCKKSFTARPNRDRHVRYHTGERPYRCDLCDLAFFRGDDLKYHRTTRHPTAQPFVCTRCMASFTWGRDLERHIRHSKCKA